MAFAVSLGGMKELEGKLNKLTTALKVDVSDEINASALKIENQAKRLAPVNFGQLRNSIALTKDGELTYSVAANASYSAYVEFGTGTKVQIPAGFESLAAKYRGKGGGTFDQLLENIKDWCRRKGIDEKLAYPIAVSIVRTGIKPQPYFIPAYLQNIPIYEKRLLKTLEREAKKYNAKK